MPVDPELRQWVVDNYEAGYSRQQLRDSLRRHGRDPSAVDEVLGGGRTGTGPSQQTPPSPRQPAGRGTSQRGERSAIEERGMPELRPNRTDEKPGEEPNKLFYVLPALFGIIGGGPAYWLMKEDYPDFARNMIILGVVVSVLHLILAFFLL